MKEKILITSALPYINNVPHIGHIIGSHLPADIFARFHRTYGDDVVFIGGADEHGTPAVVLSKQTGVPVKKIVDTLKAEHKKVYDKLNISYDNFSGTSIPMHVEITQDFANKMNENGYIHTDTVEQYYCENCQMFLPDRFLRGTCPKCGYDDCDADQCEKCYSVINAYDLINPHCYNCGGKPIIKKSTHLFFDMPKAQKAVDEYLESKKDIFKPYVYAEAKRWMTEGLKSRCITRDMEWGVPVNYPGLEDKVFYVWFEALLGYVTFTKQYDENFYEEVWKKRNGKIYHFLGKDNIPFHAVFFPAMLVGNGEHNFPYDIAGYNFLNYEGKKFSKSKRIGVFCTPLLTSDLEVDALRGYLTNILPETKDSDWKWEEFKNFVNSELVGKYGNFFNRTINLLNKNFPTLDVDIDTITLDEEDKDILQKLKDEADKITDLYKNIKLRDAFRSIMLLSIDANTYLEHKAPWNLIKEGKLDEAKKVLYICLNICRTLAILASPVLPEKTQEVWEQLNLEGQANQPDNWAKVGKVDIAINHKINEPKPLFRRIDDDYLESLKEHFSIPYELNFD